MVILVFSGGPKGTDFGNGESQYTAGPYVAGLRVSGFGLLKAQKTAHGGVPLRGDAAPL